VIRIRKLHNMIINECMNRFLNMFVTFQRLSRRNNNPSVSKSNTYVEKDDLKSIYVEVSVEE
jgi:hypothetical protein